MTQKKIDYLVELISENDDQLAFNELYQYFFPGLFSFASSVLKSRGNAEEIILDVFLRL